MEDEVTLTILMATYNGAAYIKKQLDSIINQTYSNWELMIRDDGSTDGTLEIIEDFSNRYARITLINYGSIHGSACRNFSQLFDWAYGQEKGYILFADQDDVWLENKLRRTYVAMLEKERLFGAHTPLLLYSNLLFIDANDQPIKANLPLPATLTLPVLLNENYAWGCTMMLNRAALQKVQHIPVSSVNHDYYIALVIAAFGKNILLDDHLILYRQHQKNVSGNVGKMTFASRFHRYFKQRDAMLIPLLDNYSLVDSFFNRYKNELSHQHRHMIGDFLESYQRGFLVLVRKMVQHKIFKIGLGKNLMYFYTLYLLRSRVVESFKQGRQG